jgi:hypothetical protein
MPDMRGRAPASELQKAIARNTITITQPWRQSTGPKSKMGKLRSSGKIHRWSCKEQYPSEGRLDHPYLKEYHRRVMQMNECLRRLGLEPSVRSNPTITYYGPTFRRGRFELGYLELSVKFRCLAAHVPILEKHCPGWHCPESPPESLPRVAEGIPAVMADESANVNVQSLAEVI